MVTVLTLEPVFVFEAGAEDFDSDLLTLELEYTLGVENPLDGFASAECWISFPCSVMRAGPSFAKLFRSCGRSFDRTRSLTGCLL